MPGDRPWRRRGWVVYLVLVVASQIVSAVRTPTPSQPSPPYRWIDVPAFRDDEELAGRVRVAVADLGPRDAPAVLLLHGSPGSSDAFAGLTPRLTSDRRVLLVDLPGFGRSDLRAPDYSLRTHARQALAVLDTLAVDHADVVAFSMGGGVALNMIDLEPARVRSLTLLSSIGVQELELLGNYQLNHLIHGFQLWGLRALRVLVPHFGAWPHGGGDEAYGRNFYDSDQRPLREILRRVAVPTLILQGEADPLVPVAAAREHHRLVPQSQLQLHPEGHLLLWQRVDWIQQHLTRFLSAVDRGTVATLATADPARRRAAAGAMERGDASRTRGFALVVLGLLIVLGTFLTEDLTCIATGLMISLGRLDWWTGLALCFTGIFVGDLLLYAAGRVLGPRVTRRAPLSWVLNDAKLEEAAHWFERRGMAVIFLTRFVPGLRLPTYVAAGVLRARLATFVGYFLIAVLVWTPLIVGLATLAGASSQELLETFQRGALWILVGLAGLIFVVVRGVPPLFTWRGRRQLVGRWRRWTRWEFWPPWAFYPPVVVHVLGLALRHRSLGLITAANPGIQSGGFVGESKAAILDLFGDDPRIATWILLRVGDPEAGARAAAFVEEHGLPVVLKPDVGERGDGVRVVRDAELLRVAVQHLTRDHLLQVHVPGVEVGVFYIRSVEDTVGRIFSVTRKLLPEVVGDGTSSLERLILDDERAVCMAPHYLRLHAAERDRVLAAGERKRLVDLGTHSRGAVFLDGRDLITDDLVGVIDELSRKARGFHFGRYDLRGPDEASIRAGRDLRVLELNGVTSEASHVYDPAWSLTAAQRVLKQQWSLAFEVAAANRARGAVALSTLDLVRLVLNR